MIKIFHHLFFLKNPKGYKQGPVPIYLRITISGKRAEISLNRKVDPTKWLSDSGRMKGCSEIIRKFNSCLVAFESKLYDAFLTLIRENEAVTAVSLKNKYTGASDRQRMLIPIFQKHNNEMAALVPNNILHPH